MTDITVRQAHRCFGGELSYCSHISRHNQCEMQFAIFAPPSQADKKGPTPYLTFLSGLTCSEENFTTKAGAFKKAAELGLALLIPDTSPRGEAVADDDAYDLGQGAGFYLNATQEPWASHFQMEAYIIRELLPQAESYFNLNPNQKSITGHSMGGHGALTLYYKYPDIFTSCSAFAPIVAPCEVPWGQKAFSHYLGDDHTQWEKHDACELVAHAPKEQRERTILIDQGLADQFLESQLKPELFKDACHHAGQSLTLRQHEGYDHSYFFIQSFIDDHLNFHHQHLHGNLPHEHNHT